LGKRSPKTTQPSTAIECMGKLNDLTGRQFGRLTVLYRAKNKGKKTYWWCRCTCNTEKAIWAQSLLNGDIQSCRCLNKEQLGNRRRTHGLTKSPTYKPWQHMLERCLEPKTKNYKDYGGRGIVVCERWLDFNNFLYDMGMKPPGLEIERKNNNGNYEPNNCCWATRKEQSNNKRNNRFLAWGGRTQTIRQWEEELGFKRAVLWGRLKKHPDWPVEKLLFTPHKKDRELRLTFKEKTQTISQWAREIGKSKTTILHRLQRHPNWPMEKLLDPTSRWDRKEPTQ